MEAAPVLGASINIVMNLVPIKNVQKAKAVKSIGVID